MWSVYVNEIIFISDESLALRLLVNRHTSLLPSLRSHLLRSVDTGSCLQLEYRSVGIQLKIGITSHTLTELPESREWKTAKINIRRQLQNYKVWQSFMPFQVLGTLLKVVLYVWNFFMLYIFFLRCIFHLIRLNRPRSWQ